MSNSIDDELNIYFDLIREELHALPDNVFSSPILKELDYLITDENIVDAEIYVLNKRLFNDFLEVLQSYNHSGHEVEILEYLQDRASNLLNLLKLYISESDSIVTKSNNENKVLEERVNSLKKGISILENQQKKISEQNKSVLTSQHEANRIISELKDKNKVYSQLIDENSNARILKLYDDIYNCEIAIADKYREWALYIFLVVGSLIILSILFILIQNTFSFFWSEQYSRVMLGWESLVKTVMLFSLTTPAWYLTRESSKHRKVAYKAKTLGTELASFPLYAREFKDEARLELRKHLADRFFGQELYNDSKTDQNSNHSLEQIKLLTEANRVLTESLKVKKLAE